MNLGTLLRNSANGYMAARMAKQVSTDLVRRLPYAAIGAAVVLEALTGVMLNRRSRSRSREA